ICYIGGARNNLAGKSDLFDLPEYVIPVFAMTVGVPTKKNEVKPRLPLEGVVYVSGFNEEKYNDLLNDYDEIFNNYINTSTNNKKIISHLLIKAVVHVDVYYEEIYYYLLKEYY